MRPLPRPLIRTALAILTYWASWGGLLSGTFFLMLHMRGHELGILLMAATLGLIAWAAAWVSHFAMTIAWIADHRGGKGFPIAWCIASAVVLQFMVLICTKYWPLYVLGMGFILMLPHIALALWLTAFHCRKPDLTPPALPPPA